jgi:ATP/maltotriose-dependent transcriptional regulator MalT
MIPGATEQQMRWVDDLMRVSVSASTMVRAKQERNNADVSHLLPQLRVPTLVLHALGDRMNSFEHGRHLASSILGARLVALESQNHILLEDEPAWPVFLDEVERFLAPDRAKSSVGPESAVLDTLTDRELEVLTLAAQGRDNEDIAEALRLSVRTVERHLQNIYGKLDVQGKSARAAAVARLLTTS